MTALADYMQERRIGVGELSHNSGVPIPKVYAIVKGTYRPRFIVARRVAKALGLTVDELYEILDGDNKGA